MPVRGGGGGWDMSFSDETSEIFVRTFESTADNRIDHRSADKKSRGSAIADLQNWSFAIPQLSVILLIIYEETHTIIKFFEQIIRQIILLVLRT